MLSVVKATGATLANGALQLVYQDSSGMLADVFAAAFQVYDTAGTQIFPVTLGTRQTIDVSVGGASRGGVGRYNALWTSSAQDVGRYYVHWYLTPSSGAAEVSFEQEFEIVPEAYRGPYYCSVQDIRDEGLTEVQLADGAAQRAIVRASRYVQLYTGRDFASTYRILEVNGRRSRALLLDEPIIAVEKVTVTFDSVFSTATQAVDTSSFKVYNRHLTQKLVSPDDRDSPRLEYVHGYDMLEASDGVSRSIFGERLIWPTGQRNIQVVGLFGYTESDDSYTGHTPDLIREACKMLVFSNLQLMAKARQGGARGPLVRERTRDQEVQYAEMKTTAMTGNRAIDNILAGFRRAPRFGAA